MTFTRSSGILLHPTSFPGSYGIGDLGPAAYRFIDYLKETGCNLWQVLPLGPTGYGDSPYQCFSAFAGNPYLVSPELLLNDGLLVSDDFADMPAWPEDKVDFGLIFAWKPALLDKAYTRFEGLPHGSLHAGFDAFRSDNSSWLADFALFMALKDANGGVAWNEWPEPLRRRDAAALAEAREIYADAIRRQEFRQFLFFRQWNALRNYVHGKGIQIVGDIPIFVAMDSADAWSHPDLFYLDEAGRPTFVAGVPPDYFSPTGQLWGNPLYRWDIHKQTGYKWWIERIRATLNTVDIVRIDHFRGFAGYWEIPGDAPTAETGRWLPGPGAELFHAIRAALGDLPIIAEDLGVITPDVVELRDGFGLPGMKIYQFAFSGPDNVFLPHHYPQNCVVYTGTHDNDTTWGWYNSAPEEERDFAHRYLKSDGSDFAWDLIRSAWASVAVFALAPLQDFLDLGTDARMNFPGKVGGFWSWRMPEGCLSDDLKARIKELNYLYER
jgi:4-alpha-glucanotransferase